MDIRIVLSADDKALEFARNLGKFFSAYVSQSDIEAGIVGKLQGGLTATIEPDTMPWEDEVEKGRAYAAEAQKAAEEKAEKSIQEHNTKQEAAAKVVKSISDEDLRASYAGDAAKKKKAGDWLKSHGLKAVSAIPQEDREDFLAAVNA